MELEVLPTVDIFGFHIAMYGLMILCGAAAGIITAVLRSGITGLNREDLVFASLYGAIGTAVGAKLLYIITVFPDIVRNIGYLTGNWRALTSLLTGGFVFYGGFIGGALAIWVYCRQYRLGFFTMIEALTPSIPLIHAFGRLGCFFAGCCYGIEFPPPIGLYFNGSPVAPHGIPLFPVQLLESCLNLFIFIVLIFIARKRRPAGIVLGLYLIMYTVARFTLEFFRKDEMRGFIFGLSTSQWISIFLLAAGIYLVLIHKNKKFSTNNPSPD